MSDVPVYKVGLILLRHADSAEPQVLLVRPAPKRGDQDLPWVLPKGSRRYKDARGILHDVRDDNTAIEQAKQLEPVTDTLLHEAQEEAGAPPKLLRAAKLYDFGIHDHHSTSSNSIQHIHFHVAALDEAQVKQLGQPTDAARPPQWTSISDMKALAAAGRARADYVPIVENAITAFKNNSLKQASLQPQKSR